MSKTQKIIKLYFTKKDNIDLFINILGGLRQLCEVDHQVYNKS